MSFEIPPETAHFVDREDAQARAFGAIADGRGGSRPSCLALSGLAGAGKTELAFRISRKLRERYPDIEAILYVDLDDLRRGGVVSATDALGELLRGLDVGPEWVEGSLRARQRQYLTRTDGRRLVVVIDNPRYWSEVVPLLPASGGAVVIVASQARLFDLEAGAAAEVVVEPLDDGSAAELLARITEDPRLAAEPEASLGLVRLCSGLPVALRVAGQWVRRHRRRSLSRLLAELTAELDEKGLPVVERVWDAAYGELSSDAALLYRLLAVFPGPSFTDEALTALLGLGKDAADDALEELENASLLDSRTGRIRLPELLRAHARRCASRDGEDGEEAAARWRIAEWFLRQAQRADRLAAGERLVLAEPMEARRGAPGAPGVRGAPGAPGVHGAPGGPEAPDVPFADKAQALRWLDAERHALYGCVHMAYAHGHDELAWALCEPLWTHFLDFPDYPDAIEVFGAGLAAAQRSGDVRAVVRMRCQLARPYWEQENFDAAARELDGALASSGALGSSRLDGILRASVVEFRGMLNGARGEWGAAAAEFDASLRLHEAIPNEYGVMLLTYRLGQAIAKNGEYGRAVELLERAHAQARELRRERLIARTGVALADALRGLGRGEEAHALYVAALESARGRDSTFDQVRILRSLGALAEDGGDLAAARRHRQLADSLRHGSGGGNP